MKRTTYLFLLVFFIAGISQSLHAQNRIGAGLAYGSEIETGAVGINGEFFLNKKIAVSPGFLFYFEDFWEANGNLNFVLTGTDAVLLYGIGGLNFATSNGNSEIGLNAGIGTNFDIGLNARPFAEAKYVLGEFDQLVLFGGIKFPIKI